MFLNCWAFFKMWVFEVATLFLAWNKRVEVGKWGGAEGGWVLINSPVGNSLKYNKGNWNKRDIFFAYFDPNDVDVNVSKFPNKVVINIFYLHYFRFLTITFETYKNIDSKTRAIFTLHEKFCIFEYRNDLQLTTRYNLRKN